MHNWTQTSTLCLRQHYGILSEFSWMLNYYCCSASLAGAGMRSCITMEYYEPWSRPLPFITTSCSSYEASSVYTTHAGPHGVDSVYTYMHRPTRPVGSTHACRAFIVFNRQQILLIETDILSFFLNSKLQLSILSPSCNAQFNCITNLQLSVVSPCANSQLIASPNYITQ